MMVNNQIISNFNDVLGYFKVCLSRYSNNPIKYSEENLTQELVDAVESIQFIGKQIDEKSSSPIYGVRERLSLLNESEKKNDN